MTKKNPTVTLNILNKEYIIACQPEDQATLLVTAQQLNSKMRRLHDSGKVTGTDRIAVMAALNLAHEIELSKQHVTPQEDVEITDAIIHLRHKIENVLENS